MAATASASRPGELRLCVADPQILSEIVEGEAVVLDLRSGFYFSLDPVASAIWEQLVAGATEAEIVGTLHARFEVTLADAAPAVEEFIARLHAEGLVITAPLAGEREPASPPPGGLDRPRAPFNRPLLTRYDDVQDLLLLDPIHDVAEAGWPVAGNAAPAAGE